jgi:hypothetical protein
MTILRLGMLLAAMAGSVSVAAQAPVVGRWAAANDPVAKMLIEQERLWATHACKPNNVLQTLIADDFVGTSPEGTLYTKPEMLPKPGAKPATPTERDCKLISARVRYFGPDVAVVYGRESAIEKGADGKDKLRVLVWTDTFLRRAGKWQIIAVQDMDVPAR